MTSSLLNKVFERALFAGKKVRGNTALGRKNISALSAAFKNAVNFVGGFKGKTVFVLGARVVAYNIAQACVEAEAGCLIVANRTYERARVIAAETGAKAVRFDDFYALLRHADVIFSATASPHYILNERIFRIYRDNTRPIVLVDLALPRDIDPALAQAANVRLLDLDDLGQTEIIPKEDIIAAELLVTEKHRFFMEKQKRSCVSV